MNRNLVIENQGVYNYQPQRNNKMTKEYEMSSPAYAYNNQFNDFDENIVSSDDESGFTEESCV